MNVFKMAWRNMWRSRRRTLVTIAAITLALLSTLLYSGLVEGYLRAMESNILDLELGEVHVYAEGYLDKPSIYTLIEEPEALLTSLESRGYRACSRLLGGALVAGGESSSGASLRGVQIGRDAKVSQIGGHVARGEWLAATDPGGVVLGRRLARALHVEPGDELVALSQATDGSMANDLYHVRGVLKSISDGTDRGGVFMTAEAFRTFFVLPEGAHQIIVRRPEGLELGDLVREVEDLAPGLDVKSWRSLMPILATLLDSTRGMVLVLFTVVYIVIAILILNAMLMAVFERIREFGVLKALGVSPGRVVALVLVESGLKTGLAMAVALALSVPGFWYLIHVGIDTGRLGGTSMGGIAWNPIWRAVVTPGTVAGPVLTLVFIVLVAVLYPAVKAARISPVEAMRHR